jgi:hypothetical protein
VCLASHGRLLSALALVHYSASGLVGSSSERGNSSISWVSHFLASNFTFDRTAGPFARRGRSTWASSAYAVEFTWFESRKSAQDRWHEPLEMHHAVEWSTDKQHAGG